MKLTSKWARARTGLLFAPGGFTAAVRHVRADQKAGDVLVILVNGDDLERWIEADDRHAVLADLYARAAFAGAT